MAARSAAVRQTPLMRRFSTLAGPVHRLVQGQTYKVGFTDVMTYDNFFYRYWTRFVAYGALAMAIGFGAVLYQPAHWLIVQQPDSPLIPYSAVMLACIFLLHAFMVIGTVSATRSTLKAKDPVPVKPPKNLRVAFVTTRAPGEPVRMVRHTLEAALRVKYRKGKVDVWLLDETNDPSLIAMCKELGVHHFSRAGVPEWNTVKDQRGFLRRITHRAYMLLIATHEEPVNRRLQDPFYAAASKHGNFNSWRAYLRQNGIVYDILAGVDTDQVPEPNYLQRLLGYFRDEDVAYVVGPQVYGNYASGLRGVVARWAESQASFFQSTIQRAGNATTSAMFVGTNYAVRMPVLDQIGGMQPCITEDMATGLAIHACRNPATGRRWKSVYTPDVVAIGEGPDFWAPYFTQQWRWAAGTFDTWRRMVWRVFFKLSPGAMLHYFLMLTYYPMTALGWLLAIVSGMIYLTTGATAVLAPWGQFVALYMMMLVTQLSLYFWNRRYNVSPHEPEGSLGVPGMAISAITSPIYLSALFGVLMNKKVKFVVTTKGSTENPDRPAAFRIHLQWAGIIGLGLLYGFLQGHGHPAMVTWVFVLLFICFVPVALSMASAVPERLKRLFIKLIYA